MFVPLHVKSEHSFGHGTAPVEDLVRRAAQAGFMSLALTDIENLHGQVKFHHAARHHGIHPITGVELRAGYGPRSIGRHSGRLVLLARDRSGYRSLCRIVTARRTRSAPTPEPETCLDLEPAGLLFLSDDAAAVERLLAAGVPAEDVRLLIARPAAVPLTVRPVASTEVIWLDPPDAPLHALIAAIHQRAALGSARGVERSEHEFPSADAVERRFGDQPQAIEESAHIAAACRFDLTGAAAALPRIDLPPGRSADEELRRRCEARLTHERTSGRWREAAYDRRLERELAVVRIRGLAGYFLVVAEIADHARSEDIELVGRGSAVGSLIVHLLGLSGVDPVEHGLMFERFLHEHRHDLPDIDLDVPSHRRDDLIGWVFHHFGHERVAMVSALQTFRRRGAWREGLKAMGMPVSEVTRFMKHLPPDDLEGKVDAPLPLQWLNDQMRAMVPLIERLIGRPTHVSVHPGGVLITEPRIDEHLPLERAPKGVRVTQFDLRSLAALGVVKIDLLGNRASSAIETARRWIPHPVVAAEDDPSTLELLRAGATVGCFQIETPPVRSVLKRLPLSGLSDLADALAIVRPGPASGEAKETFIRRARGEIEEPVLPAPLRGGPARTHGLLLYEEDVIDAIASMTGSSIEDADAMRAELVEAGDSTAARAALASRFMAAATAAGARSEEAADTWRSIERFAAYSFNRAHATSYAQVAWRCAFLKAHHPLEYGCGVLDHYGGAYPLRTIAAELARIGVSLLGPHVNESDVRSRTERGHLRLGLSTVTRLTEKSRDRLLEQRPFADMADFLRRAEISRPEREALVLCGACDGLAPLDWTGYPFTHEAVLGRVRTLGTARALEDFVPPEARGEKVDMYRRLVRVFHEIRFLGMHPTEHPMQILRSEATRVGCVTSRDLGARHGVTIRFAGIVAAGRRLVTRHGPVMHFVTLEDEYGLIEAVVFPGVYGALRDPIRNPGPFLLSGRVAGDPSDPNLVVSDVLPFHLRERVRSVAP